jgi:hypothetical protein
MQMGSPANHLHYSISLNAPRKTFSGDELLARNIEATIWHRARRINEPGFPVKPTQKYSQRFYIVENQLQPKWFKGRMAYYMQVQW